LSNLLHAHQHFFTPALSAVMLDVGQVMGVWLLGPLWGVAGLAWGSVLGALLGLCVQAPVFMHHRIASRPQLALRLTGLRELLRLMGPRIVTLGVIQAVDLVFIRLASGLPAGSIAAFGYANLLIVGMPRTLFGTAIATVVFPTLVEQYNAGQYERLKRTMLQAVQAVWAFAVPGAAGVLALGPAAVAFLFERGAFSPEATALVYSLLALLSLRLIGETTNDILVLPLYARHDTRSPMWVSLGWMVVNVGLSFALVGRFGIHGLVLAGTIALLAALAGLYVYNRRAFGSLREQALARSLGRILLATGGMCLVVFALRQLPLPIIPSLVLTITTGGVVYSLLYFVLGGRELLRLAALVLPGGRLRGADVGSLVK
jgi:putative peptidoglycan lipid II flippase